MFFILFPGKWNLDSVWADDFLGPDQAILNRGFNHMFLYKSMSLSYKNLGEGVFQAMEHPLDLPLIIQDDWPYFKD